MQEKCRYGLSHFFVRLIVNQKPIKIGALKGISMNRIEHLIVGHFATKTSDKGKNKADIKENKRQSEVT